MHPASVSTSARSTSASVSGPSIASGTGTSIGSVSASAVSKEHLPEDLQRLRAQVLEGLEYDSDEVSGEDEHADDDSNAGWTKVKQAEDAATVSELTEAAVLFASGEERLEDVTQLVFRGRGLASLTTPRTLPLPMLANVEVLSLSNNCLVDISPLSSLESLTEVNLNFNQIEDIEPLFECELLEKLFVAHNRVSSITGLDESCPNLLELSLYANRLSDGRAAVKTLRGLRKLRRLDAGENDGLSAPSQRYRLIRGLRSLETLDGLELTTQDRQRAADFQEACNASGGNVASGEGCTVEQQAPSEDLTASSGMSLPRPGTAPAAYAQSRGGGARPRPPPMPAASRAAPGAAAAGDVSPVTLSSLPGQRLRSARANRIDDVLSREPSPEDSGVPILEPQKIDLSDPGRALRVLATHSEALRRRLEIVNLEKENLRFQVRLLQKDASDVEPQRLQERLGLLEAENRNARAVHNENSQLQARLVEVERLLEQTATDETKRAATAAERSSAVAAEDDADAVRSGEDRLEELRWENELLEKRLVRLKRYQSQMHEDVIRASLQSSSRRRGEIRDYSFGGLSAAGAAGLATGAEAGDLESLISKNEDMLRHLRCEVRDTATAVARGARGEAGLIPAADGRRPTRADAEGVVDVLTIGESGAADVEWHRSRTSHE